MRDPAKPYWTDYILNATVLKLIPRSVKPNHVTVFRFIATPFVVVLIALQHYAWGIPVFIFVAFTDAIDGAMARMRGQITRWGTIYDPIADKLLVGSLIVVVVFKEINIFVGIALLVLEAVFIATGAYRLHKGIVTPANIWGKIKMLLQVIGLTLLLVAGASHMDTFLHISIGSFVLAMIFALVSLVTYGV